MSVYKNDWMTEIDESSQELSLKMEQAMDKFNEIVKDTNNFEQFTSASFDVMKFFYRCSNTTDSESLLSTLNSFFNVVDQIVTEKFRGEKVAQFFVHLRLCETSELFKMCSKFWIFYYKLMKMEDPKDTKSYRSRFGVIHQTKNPLVTKALMILQNAHRFLEEQEECQGNEDLLLFYLNELLSISNLDIVQEVLCSRPKFSSIIENTKQEIACLLKCLFGLEFQSRPCNHSLVSQKDLSHMDKELAEKILSFYLPKELDEKKIDKELIEVCENLKVFVEEPLTNELKERFNKYFASVHKFSPECTALNNKMKDLNQEYSHFLTSPCVDQISNERRLILAKASFVLAIDSFQRKNENTLALAKNCLMFGQELLGKKLTAKVWLLIGKCLSKFINTPNFNLSRCDEILSPFYMSLLLNKEEAETHIRLAIMLHRVFLIYKSYLSPDRNPKARHVQNHQKFYTRFVRHIYFAISYIQMGHNVTNLALISKVSSVVHILLASIEANHVNALSPAVKQFFGTSIKYLSILIERQIQRISIYSNDSIGKICNDLLDLNQKIKTCCPIAYDKGFQLLVKNLESAWINATNQSQQSSSSSPIIVIDLDQDENNKENQHISADSHNTDNLISLSHQSNSVSHTHTRQTFSEEQSTQQLSSLILNNQDNRAPQNQSTQQTPMEQQSERNPVVAQENEDAQQTHLVQNTSLDIQQTSLTHLTQNDDEEDKKFEVEIEKEKERSRQLKEQADECEKNIVKQKLDYAQKKFTKLNDQLKAKNSELKSQLDKSLEDNKELTKQNDSYLEKIQMLEKENERIIQVCKKAFDELKNQDESRMELKRRRLDEDVQYHEKKRSRQNEFLNQLGISSVPQPNDSGNEFILE